MHLGRNRCPIYHGVLISGGRDLSVGRNTEQSVYCVL